MHARHTSLVVDHLARLIMAMLGGILFLVLMTVLAFLNSLKWTLITICLFVVFFSVVLSLVSRVSNDQVLAATAAYSAVMVVFVASTLPLTVKNWWYAPHYAWYKVSRLSNQQVATGYICWRVSIHCHGGPRRPLPFLYDFIKVKSLRRSDKLWFERIVSWFAYSG